MVSTKLFNILILAIGIILLYFYLKQDKGREHIYEILGILYFTYVFTLFFESKDEIVLRYLILFGLIAILAHIFKHSMNWIRDNVQNTKSRIHKNKLNNLKKLRKLNKPYIHDIEENHSVINIEFSLYLDVINKTNDTSNNINLITVNDNCSFITIDLRRNLFLISEYDCNTENGYVIEEPIKHMAWINFNIEIKEQNNGKPADYILYINNKYITSGKLPNIPLGYIDTITFYDSNDGEDFNFSIGFIKNIKITSY